MLYPNCNLVRDAGNVFAEAVGVDLKFRSQSTIQPDNAPLWYGTLIPPSRLVVSRGDVFTLQISGAIAGDIQIQEEPHQESNTIQFNGISERPQLQETPELEPAAKTCEECGSPFFAPASRMDGLCPECSHHTYGYPNCEHDFSENTCSKCGWDGSVSAFVKSLK